MRKSTTKHTNAISSWFPYSLFADSNKVRFISFHVSFVDEVQCCGIQGTNSRTREGTRRASWNPAESVSGRRPLKHILLLVVSPVNWWNTETGRFRGTDDTLYTEKRLVRKIKKKHNYQSIVKGISRPVMLYFTQLRDLQRGGSLSHRGRRWYSLEPFSFLRLFVLLERFFYVHDKASSSRWHGNFRIWKGKKEMLQPPPQPSKTKETRCFE